MPGPWEAYQTADNAPTGPWANYAQPNPAAAPATPAQPGRAKSALDEITGSWHNLVNDVKTATAPTLAQPARRNGPLPANANLIDKGLHFLAGGDNGTGEVQTNTPGGKAAVAADRVGGDILELPLSVGRGVAKFVNPNLSSEQAQAYTAAALAGVPVAGAVAREAAPALNALIPKASPQVAANALAMDRAGVQPSLAAASQGRGVSAMANTVAENPLAGAPSRGRMRNQIAQTGQAADNIAGQYGNVRGPQITGENVQAGITRFAQDAKAPDSFKAKSDAIYDRVFEPIQLAEQKAVDTASMRATQSNQAATAAHEAQLKSIADQEAGWRAEVQRRADLRTAQGGNAVTPENVPNFDKPAAPVEQKPIAVVYPTETSATLQQLSSRANAPNLSKMITDPRYSKIASALSQDAPDVRFGDLRELRTWVRNAQRDPDLRQGISQADLQRLEGSLTQDIYSNAERLGGKPALAGLQRADAFYRSGSQRIQTALQSFDNANAGESAYSRIVQAAGSTGTADAQKLLSLKRSLRPEEWGDVAANVISDLGKPKAGSAGMGEDFSVSTFLTNYSKMSPRGREVLFGSIGGGGAKASSLRGELDNLAHVAGLLKGVEKGANTSKTAVSGQAVATLGGLVTPHLAGPTAALLGTMGVTGEALTNPAFVRWLARNSKVPNSPGARASAINQMGQIAKQDNRLLPFYKQLTSPQVVVPAAMASEQTKQGANQP